MINVRCKIVHAICVPATYILFVTLDFSFQLKLVLLKEFVIIRGFCRKDITQKKL